MGKKSSSGATGQAVLQPPSQTRSIGRLVHPALIVAQWRWERVFQGQFEGDIRDPGLEPTEEIARLYSSCKNQQLRAQLIAEYEETKNRHGVYVAELFLSSRKPLLVAEFVSIEKQAEAIFGVFPGRRSEAAPVLEGLETGAYEDDVWVPSAEQDDPDYEQWRWQVLTESGILQDSDYCARQGIYRFQPGVPRPPGLPAGAAQPVLRTRLCKRVGLLEGGVCQLPLCAPISADPARGYLEVKINRGPCEPHAKTGATVLCVKQPSEASAKGWAGLTVGSVFGVVHATTNAEAGATKNRGLRLTLVPLLTHAISPLTDPRVLPLLDYGEFKRWRETDAGRAFQKFRRGEQDWLAGRFRDEDFLRSLGLEGELLRNVPWWDRGQERASDLPNFGCCSLMFQADPPASHDAATRRSGRVRRTTPALDDADTLLSIPSSSGHAHGRGGSKRSRGGSQSGSDQSRGYSGQSTVGPPLASGIPRAPRSIMSDVPVQRRPRYAGPFATPPLYQNISAPGNLSVPPRHESPAHMHADCPPTDRHVYHHNPGASSMLPSTATWPAMQGGYTLDPSLPPLPGGIPVPIVHGPRLHLRTAMGASWHLGPELEASDADGDEDIGDQQPRQDAGMALGEHSAQYGAWGGILGALRVADLGAAELSGPMAESASDTPNCVPRSKEITNPALVFANCTDSGKADGESGYHSGTLSSTSREMTPKGQADTWAAPKAWRLLTAGIIHGPS